MYRYAWEIMDLLLAVQYKLKMGVPIASLINAANGEVGRCKLNAVDPQLERRLVSNPYP